MTLNKLPRRHLTAWVYKPKGIKNEHTLNTRRTEGEASERESCPTTNTFAALTLPLTPPPPPQGPAVEDRDRVRVGRAVLAPRTLLERGQRSRASWVSGVHHPSRLEAGQHAVDV